MIRQLLLLMAIVHELWANGCLKLAADNKNCAVCDSMMNYVLSKGTCVKQDIENCMISFDAGWCRFCDYGYFLDGGFNCSPVQKKTFIEITNCNAYLTVDRCMVCNLGTYLRNGVCRPITSSKIPGCTVNQGPKSCAHCNLMLPSKDRKSCVPVPSTGFSKCLFFRHPVICTVCKPGFVADPNSLLLDIDTPKMFTAFFFQLKFWKNSYFSLLMNTPVCIPSYTIPNCEVLDFNNTCSKCVFGYTLSPNRANCFVRPPPPRDPTLRVPNCYKFASETYEQCKICYGGYYLNPVKTACLKITNPVPNCMVHSQEKNSVCIYCDNEYFFDTTKTNSSLACVKRINYFTNCLTYDRTTDACTACMTGTMFHFVMKRCSLLIANCTNYDITDRILKCTLCQSGVLSGLTQPDVYRRPERDARVFRLHLRGSL